MNNTRTGLLDSGEWVKVGGWTDAFNERQLKEIAHCCVYARDFNHGTDGHNAKVIIAKMAELLNEYETSRAGDVNEVAAGDKP